MNVVREIAPELHVIESRHNKYGADNGGCSVGRTLIHYPTRENSFLGFTVMTLAKYGIEIKDEYKSFDVLIRKGLATSRPEKVLLLFIEKI